MLTCGSIPLVLFSVLFECGLLSFEATDVPADGASAAMALSFTLQMEYDGLTVTMLEAVLLTTSCFTAGSTRDSS